MSKNTNSILFWNAKDCPADSSECIYNISKLLKVSFTSIIVLANDHSQLSPDLSDAATILPITIRCGEHGIHDAIVDTVQSIMKTQKYNFVIISNDYLIWIDIFQRIHPTNLVFISKNDPRQSLSFSFLPETVKCTILQWPSLKEVTGNINGLDFIDDGGNDVSNSSQNHSKPQKISSRQKTSPQQRQIASQQRTKTQQQTDFYAHQYESENDYNSDANVYDENEEDTNDITDESSYSYSKKNQPNAAFNQKTSPPPDRIKPLSNLEKHQIDLRSPTGPSKPSAIDSIENRTKPQFNQISKDQPTVPLQFQPLIEAMKSIGKSMISLSDLEEQFSICCKNLNLPPQDLKTMIDKASSHGLIIFDSSINYVRFKNRQIANTQIVYT